MPPPQDPLAEAAELLAGLRRVREDSLRVAEFNTNLSLEYAKARKPKSQTFEWQANEQDRLLGKMARRGREEMQTLRGCIFNLWTILAQRTKRLKKATAEDDAIRHELGELLAFRHAKYEQKWKEDMHKGHEECIQFNAHVHTRLENAHAHLEEVIKKSRQTRIDKAVKNVFAKLVRDFFKAWADFEHKLGFQRQRMAAFAKTFRLIFNMEESQWVRTCVGAWQRFAEDKASKRGDNQQNKLLQQLQSHHLAQALGQEGDKLLRYVLLQWQTEAVRAMEAQHLQKMHEETEFLLEQEATLTSKFPLRCASRSLAFIACDQVDIQDFFEAWTKLGWRSKHERDELSWEQKSMLSAQMHEQQHNVHSAFHDKIVENLNCLLLPFYYSCWCCCFYQAVYEKNKVSFTEFDTVSQAVKAWTERVKELDSFITLKRLVETSERKRMNRMRTSLQTMFGNLDITSAAHNAARNRVQKDMEAARAQHALLVSDKMVLSDEVAEVYRNAKYRDYLAKHCAKRWTTLRNRDVQIWLLIVWRANVVHLKAERLSKERAAQMDCLEESLRSKWHIAQQTHADISVSVVRRTVVRYELTWCFHLWNLCCEISRHDYRMDQSRAHYDECKAALIRETGVDLARAMDKQSKQLHATTMMRGFADESELLRLSFCSWRNVGANKQTGMMAQMRKWSLMMSAGNRMSRWLVPTCYRFWKLALLVDLWEAEHNAVTELMWADSLEKQVRSKRLDNLCGRLSRNFELWLCFAAIQYWRRFHDEFTVDHVADNVQIQWSKYEQKTQVRLRGMAASCRSLAQFIPRQTKRFHLLKVAYFTFKAWERACNICKMQNVVRIRGDSASSALIAQQRFEEVAHEQWIDTCLFARSETRRTQVAHWVMGAWWWIVRNLRSQPRVLSSLQSHVVKFERASAVVQRKQVLVSASNVRLAFGGWRARAFEARCHWLRKRCRRIQEVLGQAGSSRSTPRAARPSKRKSKPEQLGFGSVSESEANRIQSRLMESLGDTSQDGGPPSGLNNSRSTPSGSPADDGGFAAKLKQFTFGVGASS